MHKIFIKNDIYLFSPFNYLSNLQNLQNLLFILFVCINQILITNLPIYKLTNKINNKNLALFYSHPHQQNQHQMKSKSSEKHIHRTQFFKNNILANQGTHFNSHQNLPFQMARLAVNQKLLYIKTCFQKQTDLKDIFHFYPHKNIESFKLPIESLIVDLNSQQVQNPQNSLIHEKKKIVKDQYGVHMIENVDILSQQEVKYHKLQKINKNKQLFNGLAISIFHNGSLFEGNYHDGRFCGNCLQISQDGDLYIGSFKDGVKKGFGIYYCFSAKQIYKGFWQNDLPHGQGIYTNSQTSYEGSFSNGLKNGFGIQKFNNGDNYAGQYTNGTPEGYGEYYWTDGSFYKGDFSHGARHGYGIWQSQSQTYFGSYRMDNKQGFGVYTWKNKKIYKGQFRDDYKQGYGQIYSINRLNKNQPKLLYKGVWQKGIKQPKLQVNQLAVNELYYFLEKQNQLINQIPIKKQKVGHRNCVPHQNGVYKH